MASGMQQAEIEFQDVYEIGPMVFVPHYTIPGLYMGPGNLSYSKMHLLSIGARHTKLLLWPRRVRA